MYELPRRSAALPVASSYADPALLAQLIAAPHKVTAYAEVLPTTGAVLQRENTGEAG